jgi:hypothetical protein
VTFPESPIYPDPAHRMPDGSYACSCGLLKPGKLCDDSCKHLGYPDSEVELAAYRLLEHLRWALAKEQGPDYNPFCIALIETFGYESWEQWVECNS